MTTRISCAIALLLPLLFSSPAWATTIDFSTFGSGLPFDQEYYAADGIIFETGTYTGYIQGDAALGSPSSPVPGQSGPIVANFLCGTSFVTVHVAAAIQGTADYFLRGFDAAGGVVETVLRVVEFGSAGYQTLTVVSAGAPIDSFSIHNEFVESPYSNTTVPFGLAQVEFDDSCPNEAPVADAGSDFRAPLGHAFTLDGSGSSDPEGHALTYWWDVVSHPAGGAPSIIGQADVDPEVTPTAAGSHVFSLVVNDGTQDSAPDTVSVEVQTADDYASESTEDALDELGLTTSGDYSAPGTQNALEVFLTQAVDLLAAGDNAGAIDRLERAVIRTDGCVLRGSPDTTGPSRDWISDCAVQADLYPVLIDALDALR